METVPVHWDANTFYQMRSIDILLGVSGLKAVLVAALWLLLWIVYTILLAPSLVNELNKIVDIHPSSRLTFLSSIYLHILPHIHLFFLLSIYPSIYPYKLPFIHPSTYLFTPFACIHSHIPNILTDTYYRPSTLLCTGEKNDVENQVPALKEPTVCQERQM